MSAGDESDLGRITERANREQEFYIQYRTTIYIIFLFI
jgi:hypothetical protein